MAIHALQSGGKDPFFRRRNIKCVAVQPDRHPPVNASLGQANMLAGLAQAANVRFNRLRQSRNGKVPLASQPVAPAPRFNLAAKAFGENIHNLCLGAC